VQVYGKEFQSPCDVQYRRKRVKSEQRIWPFSTGAGLLASVLLLFGLLVLVGLARKILDWPANAAQGGILTAVLVLSLLPIALALIDIIIARGAVVEYRGIKVDFSKSRYRAAPEVTVAANIGVRGRAVTDSGSVEILSALHEAVGQDAIVIDLEAGDAWWETRLLVLLAGAERIGKPECVVFVGKVAMQEQRYLGWSRTEYLLPRLLAVNLRYPELLQATRAAAAGWALREPAIRYTGTESVQQNPPFPLAVQGPIAAKYGWMALDYTTGLNNPYVAEQMLQSELGAMFEVPGASLTISSATLDALFAPVLYQEAIDQEWPSERQLRALMDARAPYVAITQDGRYQALALRQDLTNVVLKSVVRRDEGQDDAKTS
jgi:hypothetical protein